MKLLLPIPLLVAACVELPTPEVSTETAAIHGAGSQSASQTFTDRAIKISRCTATRISHRWAITAAHCMPGIGDDIVLYDVATTTHTGTPRVAEIIDVELPDGVVVDAGCQTTAICEDVNGDQADMALLQIAASDERVLDSPAAVLAWRFPGQVWGTQVGAGDHNGDDINNEGNALLMIDGEIDSDDSGGYFETVDNLTDSGDSGGPFYVADRVVGVLSGEKWIPFDHFDFYTSVPYRLDWILDTIDYQWLGSPPRANHRYTGTVIETINATSHHICQYACEHTSNCEAYNYIAATDQCQVVDNVTGSTIAGAANWHSALRNGGPTGVASDVVGYVRADQRNVVVHMANEGGATNDNTIREIANIPTWPYWETWNITLGAPTPAPGGKLSAYRRSDGVDAVVYRSDANEIIELARAPGGWEWNPLPGGSSTPAGAPVGLVRADGENVVIYRTTGNHIRELHLDSTGQWESTDLTNQTGAPLASSDPSAFRRADGFTSVVFRSGGDIWELFKRPGDPWSKGNVSSLTVNGWAPAADGRPHGYNHTEGYVAIVYHTAGNRVVELWLDWQGWHHGTLPSNPTLVGEPFGYVRGDAVEAVVSRSASPRVVTSSRLVEIANGAQGWQAGERTTASSPLPTTSPTAYVRTDGYNSVVYEASNDDAIEVYWRLGDAGWGLGNLSSITGEP